MSLRTLFVQKFTSKLQNFHGLSVQGHYRDKPYHAIPIMNDQVFCYVDTLSDYESGSNLHYFRAVIEVYFVDNNIKFLIDAI